MSDNQTKKPVPPPNLAISSHLTMRPGRGIIWVENFTN